jgi:DUF1680 family protein
LIRFLPSIPGLIYATKKDTLFVNLFISNKSEVLVDNKKIKVIQETDYPWNGKISVTINPEKTSAFAIKLRVPGWATNNPVPGPLYSYLPSPAEPIKLKINGKDEVLNIKNGYIELARNWNTGDKLELEFPMKVQRVITNDAVTSNNNQVALEYGPIVYCVEKVDNENNFSSIEITDTTTFSLMQKDILTTKVTSIRFTDKENQQVEFIPYYAWANRGITKMKVWEPRVGK